MASNLLDGVALLARWAHVTLAIAWLGAALLFARRGDGEGEDVVQWEAYWAWLTGFVLLVLVYYVDADLYLVDAAVRPLSRWAAIGSSLAILVATLAIYEGACRAGLGEASLGAVLLVLAALLAWGLVSLFSGRGAFVHYGAVLGTIMAGNVAHVTIPAQRRRRQALAEGRLPDEADARRLRQRLRHNAVLVPAVVFAMLSTHYPMLFAHRWSWLALAGATLVGVLVRGGTAQRTAAVVLALGIASLSFSGHPAGGASVSLEEVRPVIEARCASCHSGESAPGGVRLDAPEHVLARAARIGRAVASRAMPPGNVTHMTGEERARLERWSRGDR